MEVNIRFLIPVNEAKVGESQTVVIVDTGTSCARTNKKILRSYFSQVGVPTPHLKRVMRAMGFIGDTLGN